MTRRPSPAHDAAEALIVSDVRALSAESDELGRVFSSRQNLGDNDFRALLQVMVADDDGYPLTQSQLGQRIGVSGAAITYLVNRMVESGHLVRSPHPSDRRKVQLRHADHGTAVALSFFTPLGSHVQTALADFTAAELATAHRVLDAVIGSMRAFNAELHVGTSPAADPPPE